MSPTVFIQRLQYTELYHMLHPDDMDFALQIYFKFGFPMQDTIISFYLRSLIKSYMPIFKKEEDFESRVTWESKSLVISSNFLTGESTIPLLISAYRTALFWETAEMLQNHSWPEGYWHGDDYAEIILETQF